MQSLMGLMAPVALGTLAKQQADNGLDAAGLTKMLESQKDNILQAMRGLRRPIEGNRFAERVSECVDSAAGCPSAPHVEPARARRHGHDADAIGSRGPRGEAYYYLSGRTATAATPAAAGHHAWQSKSRPSWVPSAEGLRGTLVGIKDEASAKAALPRLQQMSQQLSGINDAAAKLPAAGHGTLATYAKQILPFLRPLIDKARGRLGVDAVARPVLDQILNRIEGLSKA
ncbi:MAG: hypothetical protein R3D67_03470 [Hyphomicrobiaceae bacterium]